VAMKSIINIYRFCKYVIIGIGGMIFGLIGLYMVTEYLHVYYMISVIIGSFILLVVNFLLNNYWTWGNNESAELKWIVWLIDKVGFMPLIKRLGVEI
jgi:putative flippase GtrA